MQRALVIARFVVVAVSLALGVAGLILPIIPGWLFFAVAVLILFPDAPFASRALQAISRRLPRLGKFLHLLQRRSTPPPTAGPGAMNES